MQLLPRIGLKSIGIWEEWYDATSYARLTKGVDELTMAQATVTMSFLLLFSSVWLRKRAYEVFLLIHIVMSVLTLVGLW